MMRKLLIIATLLALAACSPANTRCDGTRDGGIGGTGGYVVNDVAV